MAAVHPGHRLRALIQKKKKRRKRSSGVQWEVLQFYYKGGTKFTLLKFPRRCPLVLLIKVIWTQVNVGK